jgi:hypothetical protein
VSILEVAVGDLQAVPAEQAEERRHSMIRIIPNRLKVLWHVLWGRPVIYNLTLPNGIVVSEETRDLLLIENRMGGGLP